MENGGPSSSATGYPRPCRLRAAFHAGSAEGVRAGCERNRIAFREELGIAGAAQRHTRDPGPGAVPSLAAGVQFAEHGACVGSKVVIASLADVAAVGRAEFSPPIAAPVIHGLFEIEQAEIHLTG